MSTVKDQRRLEDKLRRLTLATAKKLELGWLDITVAFSPDLDADGTMADSSSTWEYRRSTITWNLIQASCMTDAELTATAVHELTHALIEPLWGSMPEEQQSALAKLGELAVENVTRAIQAAARNGLD